MSKFVKIIFFITIPIEIILIFSQLYLIFNYNQMLQIFITIFNIINILAIFMLSIFSYKKAVELKTTYESLEESKLYNKTLLVLNENVRCFKHDFSNIIQAILGYVQANDFEGLKKYFHHLLDDCQKLNTITALNPNLINNPAIYNLVTNKYQLADSKGIKFNINIFLDLKKLNINIYEFTRILGVLLDNAIEATSECNEKVINFDIEMDEKNHRQLLIIENTYKNKNVDIEKIFEKAYTSKPHNSGLGLWEIRKILNRNNNLNLFTTKNEKFFTQQLEIYL